MIMGSIVQGPWAGSGLAGLEQGTDFNCTSTSCSGIVQQGESAPGAVHQNFVNLQRAINRWSGKAGFSPIGADGLIGAATVGALQKAGNVMLGTLPGALATVAKNMFASNLTKENVAANAVTLTDSLNSAADKLEAGGALPAPRPSGSGSTAPPASSGNPSSGLPAIAPSPSAGGGNLVWWLLGGFAVVATAGIATAVVLKRRKRKGAPSSMSSRPGRRAHSY
jgi:lysozyme family protein